VRDGQRRHDEDDEQAEASVGFDVVPQEQKDEEQQAAEEPDPAAAVSRPRDGHSSLMMFRARSRAW